MIEICAIVRNENEYLKEWIDWHLALGFDRIILYDNGSAPPIPDSVKFGNHKVFVKEWKRDFAQIECYAEHARSSDAKWTAFIDIDEFITFNATFKNIRDFLEIFPHDVSSVSIHWVCYGANGHWKRPGQPVMEAYTKPCPDPVSSHYKTIARPFMVKDFPNPHTCSLLVGRAVNEANRPVQAEYPSLVSIQINHYFTKSYDEWLEKIGRGRADTTQKRTPEEFFHYNPDMKQ